MHAHDNCWRCGKWFSYGLYHEQGESTSRGRFGLCGSCWEDLWSVALFVCGILVMGLVVLGLATKSMWLTYPFLCSLFGAVVYGGIRLVQHLDNEGWFNFVDRIREKHLEPWEKDK